jgi:hypothetical protein
MIAPYLDLTIFYKQELSAEPPYRFYKFLEIVAPYFFAESLVVLRTKLKPTVADSLDVKQT